MSFILAVLYCAPPDPTGTSWNHPEPLGFQVGPYIPPGFRLEPLGTTQIPSWILYSTWIPTGIQLEPAGIQLVPAGIQLELSRMQSH